MFGLGTRKNQCIKNKEKKSSKNKELIAKTITINRKKFIAKQGWLPLHAKQSPKKSIFLNDVKSNVRWAHIQDETDGLLQRQF